MHGRWVAALVATITGLATVALGAAEEETDEARSFCYDNCSSHGRCIDNICRCDPGYHGENCATNFGLPPLSQGTANLTSKAVAQSFFAKHASVLVGISMTSCAKCAHVESEYADALKTLPIPFVRVDAAVYADVLALLGLHSTMTMPQIALVWQNGRRNSLYRGLHNSSSLVRYVNRKATGKGFARIKSPEEAFAELEPGELAALFLFSSKSPADSGESDEWEDFEEAADLLRGVHNMQLFACFPHSVKRGGDRRPWDVVGALPAVVLMDGRREVVASAHLSERLLSNQGKTLSLSDWLSMHAVPVVTELTVESFAVAEQAGLPMLIVFTPDQASMTALMDGFVAAAREFRGRITFLHALQETYKDRMSALRLAPRPYPVMAFNNKGELGPVPFPDGERIDVASIRKFCIEFLAGRIKPVDPFAAVAQQESPNAEEPDVRGVTEGIYRTDPGVSLVETQAEWDSCVMDETKDSALVVFKSKGCPDCKAFAPYIKRVAARYELLKGHRVFVCAVDLAKFHPKVLWDTKAPSLLMLPAFAKEPPFRFYSGVGKVLPMMEWIRENAGHKFEFNEELPQFDAEQKRLFKEQIRERELRKDTAASAREQLSQENREAREKKLEEAPRATVPRSEL